MALPHVVRDFELGTYFRLLVRDGVNICDTPRVFRADPDARWLPAWEESEDPDWQVYEVPNGDSFRGPLGPLEVRITRQSDGYIYGLETVARKLIWRRFPRAVLPEGLYLVVDPRIDVEESQAPIWDSVVRVLTGLSEQQIEELGGYRLLEPETGRVLRDAPALVP